MSAAMLLALAVPVLCGGVIPNVTALVTKMSAPSWLKAGLTFALSALAGALSTVVFAPGEKWQDYVLAVFAAWVSAQAAHYAGTSKLTNTVTSRFGIGPQAAAASPNPPGTPPLDPPAPPPPVIPPAVPEPEPPAAQVEFTVQADPSRPPHPGEPPPPAA